MNDPRFDVVTIDPKTRLVLRVNGLNHIQPDAATIALASPESETECVKIVKAGKYKKGDKLP